MKEADPQDIFNAAWRVCEARGDCDTFGELEYRRILRVWSAEKPEIEAPEQFIKRHFNAMPDDPLDEDTARRGPPGR